MCGCDVFWLFENPNYLDKLSLSTTCNDGTLLYDLDITPYERYCA